MAAIYSRVASLLMALVQGACGGGNSVATNTAFLVVAGAHTITDLGYVNTNGSDVFIQMFDAATAGAVTVGTTAATNAYRFQASTSGVIQLNLSYTNGLVIAVTTAVGNGTAPTNTTEVGLAYF